jgi:hypothetical protein
MGGRLVPRAPLLLGVLGCGPSTVPIALPASVSSPGFESAIVAIESDSQEKVLAIEAVSLVDPAPKLPFLDHYDGSLVRITVLAYSTPLSHDNLSPGALAPAEPGPLSRPLPSVDATIWSATVAGDQASAWRSSGLSARLSAYRIVNPNGSDPCAGFKTMFSVEVPEDLLGLKSVAAVSSTVAWFGGRRPDGSPHEGVLGTVTASGAFNVGDAPPPLLDVETLAFDPMDRVLFTADLHDYLAQLDLSGGLIRWTATPTEAGKGALVTAGSDGTAFLSLTESGRLYRLTAGSTRAEEVTDAPSEIRAIRAVRRDRAVALDKGGKLFFFDGTTWTQEQDTLAAGTRMPFMVDGDESIFLALTSENLWVRDSTGRWSSTQTDQEYFTAAALGGGRYVLLGRGDASWWSGTQYCPVVAGNGRALNAASVDPKRSWVAAIAGTDTTHPRSELVGLAIPP